MAASTQPTPGELAGSLGNTDEIPTILKSSARTLVPAATVATTTLDGMASVLSRRVSHNLGANVFFTSGGHIAENEARATERDFYS